MELRLVDAPADDVKQIVVTINRIDVHSVGGGWQTLSTVTKTVDLLALQGGIFEGFGIVTLPEGRITQFRLYVDEAGPNYVTKPDGTQAPLTVPSGEESGIKLKAGFDVPSCAAGHVTFDFDGKRSIFTHATGKGGDWILRPVIRLKAVNVASGTCTDAGASTAGTTAGASAGTDAGGTTTAGTTTAGTTTSGTTTSGTTTSGTTTSGDTGSTAGSTSGSDVDSPSTGTGTVDPADPCASVTCEGFDYCLNGVCRTPIN